MKSEISRFWLERPSASQQTGSEVSQTSASPWLLWLDSYIRSHRTSPVFGSRLLLKRWPSHNTKMPQQHGEDVGPDEFKFSAPELRVPWPTGRPGGDIWLWPWSGRRAERSRAVKPCHLPPLRLIPGAGSVTSSLWRTVSFPKEESMRLILSSWVLVSV